MLPFVGMAPRPLFQSYPRSDPHYRELADGPRQTCYVLHEQVRSEGVLATFTSLVFSLVVYFGWCLEGNFFLLFISYYQDWHARDNPCLRRRCSLLNDEFANAFLPTCVTIWMFFVV